MCVFEQQQEVDVYIMPAPPPSGYNIGHGPSCFDKIKMGFMMGFCVGMASGAIFGGFSALRYTFKENANNSSVSRYLSSGKV